MFDALALKLMEDPRANAQPLTPWDVHNLYMDFNVKAPDALKLSRNRYYELKDQMAVLQSPVQPPVEDNNPNPVFQSDDLDFLCMPAIATNLSPPRRPRLMRRL